MCSTRGIPTQVILPAVLFILRGSSRRTTRFMVQNWLLGYLEEPASATSLLRHRFPSKVGGRPAWLDPLDVPLASDLTCPLTHRPLRFLCQVSGSATNAYAAL
jgi:hypothetical protein